mmetsp:Transcript_75459/g.157367  ORF Transcript_75459/g.157367 Transcript_75459/m.157367 type:complete len:81 (+) Transcript_75459:516-758(+)
MGFKPGERRRCRGRYKALCAKLLLTRASHLYAGHGGCQFEKVQREPCRAGQCTEASDDSSTKAKCTYLDAGSLWAHERPI